MTQKKYWPLKKSDQYDAYTGQIPIDGKWYWVNLYPNRKPDVDASFVLSLKEKEQKPQQPAPVDLSNIPF